MSDMEAGVEGVQEFEQGTSSSFGAMFNIVNLLLGVGALSLPYSIKSAGWIIGVGLSLFLMFLTLFTGLLLGRILRHRPSLTSFPDIGEAAYGRKGRIFVSVALTLELIGACGIMSILFMDNVQKLFPTFPRMYTAGIFVAVVLPTTWTTKLGILSCVYT